MPVNFNFDYRAVFLLVLPDSRGGVTVFLLRQVRLQTRNVFRWSNIQGGHLEKFFVRVSVLIDCRLVNGNQGERLFVAEVHRTRIRFEQEPVLFVLFLQSKLGTATISHIADNSAHPHALPLRITLDGDDPFEKATLSRRIRDFICEPNRLEVSRVL